MVTDVAIIHTFDRAQSIATTPEPPFFAVSLLKLAVLSLCTNGLYQLYWFYRNWRLIIERENLDVSPFGRTFSAFFYWHETFTRIRDYAERKGVVISLSAGVLAAGCMIAPLCWQLPSPYYPIGHMAVVFLLPVQAAVNRINGSVMPCHDPNSRFSSWNWFGVVIGGLWMVWIVLGAFLPEQ
jgi:hypothetical protein